MRFLYQYRTRENEVRRGEVSAEDREGAFRLLRSRGVRPSRLEEAPGLMNKLLGKGKRWIAIAALAAALLAACWAIMSESGRERYAFEERAQLFGDPFLIGKLSGDGWRASFAREGDAWFARHAVPGGECACGGGELEALRRGEAAPILDAEPVAVERGDPDELKKMKRMVNCMKREFARYVAAGGTEAQYRIECETRLAVERRIFGRVKAELEGLERRMSGEGRERAEREWDEKNSLLRSMGLMTVPMPE